MRARVTREIRIAQALQAVVEAHEAKVGEKSHDESHAAAASPWSSPRTLLRRHDDVARTATVPFAAAPSSGSAAGNAKRAAGFRRSAACAPQATCRGNSRCVTKRPSGSTTNCPFAIAPSAFGDEAPAVTAASCACLAGADTRHKPLTG